MSFASRQPCKRGQTGRTQKYPLFKYSVYRKMEQNPTAEQASNDNVTGVFINYVPEKTTKGCPATVRLGGWVRRYPSGSRFQRVGPV